MFLFFRRALLLAVAGWAGAVLTGRYGTGPAVGVWAGIALVMCIASVVLLRASAVGQIQSRRPLPRHSRPGTRGARRLGAERPIGPVLLERRARLAVLMPGETCCNRSTCLPTRPDSKTQSIAFRRAGRTLSAFLGTPPACSRSFASPDRVSFARRSAPSGQSRGA
jgi:hypothetical protein